MDEAVSKRMPPYDKAAEEAVIGSMLMGAMTNKRHVIVDVADILKPEDFYHRQYGQIFEAVVQLYNEGENIDLLIVSNRLKEMGASSEVSNLDYVSDIMASTPTVEHAKAYAQIVQDKAILRKMIRFMEETTATCYSGKTDMEQLLADSEQQMMEIVQSRSGGEEFTPMSEIALQVLDNIEAAAKQGNDITGVPTGFADLDRLLTGLHPAELILIAARPSMGKTAFALNIVHYAAMRKNIPCAVFSLEMGKEQLGARLVAMDSMVNSQAIRTGQLVDSDWSKIMDSTYNVGNTPIYIDDTPGISIAELRSKCRKLKKQHNVGLIAIDYLQLMSGSGRTESRQQEISEISRSLKKLARELEVPIIALSQLNRAADSRESHRPVMSDLRESGAIEQDADVIMFIYRDDYYNKQSEKPGIADIIVAKQRNGDTGTIELVWFGKYTKFANKASEQSTSNQPAASRPAAGQ